jgi:hypothetical protein
MPTVTRLPGANAVTLPVARGATLRLSPLTGLSSVLVELRGPRGGDLGGVLLGLDDAHDIVDALTRVADHARSPLSAPAATRPCSGPDPGAAVGLLTASLDPEQTLVAFARLTVPVFADWCTIDVADGARLPRRLVVLHTDTSKRKAAAVLARYPHDPDLKHPRSAVWRTGEPDLAPEVSEARVEAVARSREHLAVLRALACRSSITVPLMTGGRVHGVMTFALCESRRWYGDDDLPVALAIARCAAIAAENARLYRHAHATLRSAVGRSPGRRTRPAREGPPKTQDVGR